MTQFVFGSGTLIMKRTDVTGTPPALIGTLQDISLDFERKLETLVGQFNVAVAIAGGEFKITGKAKYARLQATQLTNLYLGPNATQTSPAMLQMTATGETDTVASGAITVANGATFVEDLGVFSTTGVQLTPVTSGPVAGVSYVPGVAGTGTYDFATGDNGTSYLIFYSYTTASGNKIALSNALMGPVATFEVNLKQSFNYFGATKDLIIKLNACASDKLSLPFSNSKFAIAEFDFQAFADASNNIGTISLTE
jgi:hypothetical protein